MRFTLTRRADVVKNGTGFGAPGGAGWPSESAAALPARTLRPAPARAGAGSARSGRHRLPGGDPGARPVTASTMSRRSFGTESDTIPGQPTASVLTPYGIGGGGGGRPPAPARGGGGLRAPVPPPPPAPHTRGMRGGA